LLAEDHGLFDRRRAGARLEQAASNAAKEDAKRANIAMMRTSCLTSLGRPKMKIGEN
jgi:hypothetical protein